jgi:hypothetical protein
VNCVGVRRHFAAIFILLASVLAAASCVSVPTTGPVEEVKGQEPGCQNCLNLEVRPPAPGADSVEIVEGYLRATSIYQPNYSVAKQFLTPAAAERWSPEKGTTIYRRESVMATADDGTVVRLQGQLVGALGPDRTYTAHDKTMSFDFGLIEENGEWRINSLPKPGGLMVEEFYFDRFYQNYDLYFVGNGGSLVPDPIYLPTLRNPANVASALVKGLLNGPSHWLRPAVSSVIPANTSLSGDSVTITNGIAEVPLSDSVLALPEPERGLLAAQIVYTLQQIGGIKGVLIKVNQQPYRVPWSDPSSLVISLDAIPQGLSPVRLVSSEQLYVVQGGRVKRVTTTSGSPTVEDLTGPFGQPSYRVDALAVSVTNQDLAVTTNARTALQRAPIEAREADVPASLLTGVSDLLRPQFTRYDEIWTIGRQGNEQRIWMSKGEGQKNETIPIDSPDVVNGEVRAFRISPDGTRMALVRNTANGSELGLARIVRSENRISVEGWRALDVTRSHLPPIGAIQDVAWLDDTELFLLGASDRSTAYGAFRVQVDASGITPQGGPETGEAVGLAVLPGTQPAIIVGRGQTWRYDGNQWLPFVEGVSTAAYPG